jgi:hypothetical protein
MQNGFPTSRRQRALPYFRRLATTLCLLSLVPSAWLRGETALEPGEELTYSVRWAILPAAGEIRIAAARHIEDGTPRLCITTTTETRGFAKTLMTFQARSESVFDLRSGRIIALHESSDARSKHTEYSVEFDHGNQKALFTRKAEPTRALALPEGEAADLITTLMKTRLWDLEVAQSRDALVSYRDDFYVLTVHATSVEQVKTPLGEFATTVLEPRMEKTPPKGMFKRGSTVKVWIAQDDHKLPVQFQVEFKIGTGTATLDAYRPPAPAR